MTKPVIGFSNDYAFLSNFFPSPVVYDDDEYPTVEHAYQAAKTYIYVEREKIRKARTPGIAKQMGSKKGYKGFKIHIYGDWETLKLGIMYRLVKQKFKEDSTLKQALLDTGDAVLVEENTWGDVFWGVCNGNGLNNLGKLLMQVRKELSEA